MRRDPGRHLGSDSLPEALDNVQDAFRAVLGVGMREAQALVDSSHRLETVCFRA